MNTVHKLEDLREKAGLTAKIASDLARIVELQKELISEDVVKDIVDGLASLRSEMETIKELNDDLPGEDYLDSLLLKAQGICSELKRAGKYFNHGKK